MSLKSIHTAEILAAGYQHQLGGLPEFWDDPNFGLMGKYKIAWHAIVRSLLGESGFYSIAHLLEANSELECSKSLAANFYYKQALQVLRGFLEHIVVQLYMCENEKAFVAWQNSDFRIPRFRGRHGMLQHLVSKAILSEALADDADALYSQLNGAIHGAFEFFSHGGRV